MRKMSTGEDSTLGAHRKMAAAVFGKDSPAVKFLDKKIAEAENGEQEEVIVPEEQLVMLLGQIHLGLAR